MPNVKYGFFPLSCSQLSLFVHFKSSTKSKISSFPGSIYDIQNSTVILSLPPTTNKYFQQEFTIHKQCTVKLLLSSGLNPLKSITRNFFAKNLFSKSPQWHRVKLVLFYTTCTISFTN